MKENFHIFFFAAHPFICPDMRMTINDVDDDDKNRQKFREAIKYVGVDVY